MLLYHQIKTNILKTFIIKCILSIECLFKPLILITNYLINYFILYLSLKYKQSKFGTNLQLDSLLS
mgnify:CR=1 FL=1